MLLFSFSRGKREGVGEGKVKGKGKGMEYRGGEGIKKGGEEGVYRGGRKGSREEERASKRADATKDLYFMDLFRRRGKEEVERYQPPPLSY